MTANDFNGLNMGPGIPLKVYLFFCFIFSYSVLSLKF